MSSFKPWLRRLVGEQDLRKVTIQLAKFAMFKLPITAISVLSLWALRQTLLDMFWAGLINSLLAQLVEFMILRDKVFNSQSRDRKVVLKQFLVFWGWAAILATLEGLLLLTFERWEWNYFGAYFVAHIPTFFLRFIGDKKIVFGKLDTPPPPSS